MYCTGRLFVDDIDYAMMRCKISIPGYKINNIGTVLAPPSAPSFTIKIESRQESNFHRWINDIQIKDHVKLKFSSVNMDGQSKTFDLYDVRCISNQESFSFDGEAPMTNTLTLIPGILVAEGVLLRVQKWRIQDPAVIMGQVEPKVINSTTEEEKNKELYLVDENNNKINKVHIGQEVELVVKTTGKIGKITTINLSSKKHDYLYKGERLQNDIIEDYPINKDIERIPLTVVAPQNQEE